MNKIIYALLTLAFFAFGCNSASINAEEKQEEKPKQIAGEDNTAAKEKRTPIVAVSVSSVLGTYDYDTEKDGEGYDNSMEITAAADGKLFVYISGSYLYKIGETQNFKEAEGKGDAALKGNRADARLVDEAGKLCRATIIFKNNMADVKISDTCQFNIRLGGVYKKADSTQKKTEENSQVENNGMPEIAYEKMMDYVNDYDARKVGEKFIITDVPSEILDQKNRADEMGNASYRGFYYLQGVTGDDAPSYSVLVSKAMLESLKKNVEYEPVILRMTAVIAESKGEFDIFRFPLVTKIEGFNSDGDVIWMATGGHPTKLNFID